MAFGLNWMGMDPYGMDQSERSFVSKWTVSAVTHGTCHRSLVAKVQTSTLFDHFSNKTNSSNILLMIIVIVMMHAFHF